MLQIDAVPPEVLRLLKSLQQDRHFREFLLAGGTALALHLGHRESIDIDLFTSGDFDLHAIKSLCYFDDIDQEQDWPGMIKEQELTLQTIKERILRSRDQYLDGKFGMRGER